MVAGLYRILSITVGGCSIQLDDERLRRVQELALAPRRGEFLRFYCGHDDPWFELDLADLDPALTPGSGLEIRVEFARGPVLPERVD